MASGVSGGGWICCGAALLLAKANKDHMIKGMYLWAAMLSNEWLRVPKDKWNQVPHSTRIAFKPLTDSVYVLLATDLAK